MWPMHCGTLHYTTLHTTLHYTNYTTLDTTRHYTAVHYTTLISTGYQRLTGATKGDV